MEPNERSDAEPISREPIATGDRRDETHLEPDPDQLVKMRATFDMAEPPGPELTSDQAETPLPDPGVTDIAEARDGPSVWDARPADEDSAPGHT